MDASALFYILLVVLTVGFALIVQNQAYVPVYLRGRYPAYWDRRRARNFAAEVVIYGLLAGVSACRVAIGADYWVYWANFQLIAQDRHVSYEIGFCLVVKLMQAIFGPGTYRTIFFLFSVLTVFFFLKALHDQACWYAASLYLLLAGGYYFSSMHSVRYYFALAIALFCAKYVIRGEYGKFVLWILLAATFHKSVLLVLPVYLFARALAQVHWKGWHYAALGALAAAIILGQGLWQRIPLWKKVIFYFYPFYENSAFDQGRISWANVAKCLGVLALGILCWRSGLGEEEPGEEVGKAHAEPGEAARASLLEGGKPREGAVGPYSLERLADRFYFTLNLGGLLVYTCGSFIPEVSRVGYYFIIFQVILIPNLLRRMKAGLFKNLCTIASLGAFAVYFVEFLRRAYDDSVRLLPYLEWIFH